MNTVTTQLKEISNTNNSVVISPGHKRTEVGVLPKDWSVRSLRSCLFSVPSYGINEAAVPFDDNLPTYLRITDISEEGQFRPSPRVSVKHPSGQAFFLNKGDLVLARTGASVGKSYLYNPKDGPLVFAGFLIRVSPNPEKLHPTFLAYWLQSKYYWNWVTTMSIRSGQPGINGKEYGELQLPLPSLEEQHAIAEALSDVDGLLNALDALIAKKQAIKQAVMQQLLTGKTRLPGFRGVWETKKFGDLFKRLNGNPHKIQTPEYSVNGLHPVIDQGQDLVVGYSDQTEKLFKCPADGVIVFGDHTRIVKFVDVDFLIGADGTQLLAMKGDNVTKFLCYQLSTKDIPNTGYNRHFKFLKDLTFKIPRTEEQRAIASVLSDMDTEITALEQRRDKTIAIKQGMMQQLLTGRVRLSESRIIADDAD